MGSQWVLVFFKIQAEDKWGGKCTEAQGPACLCVLFSDPFLVVFPLPKPGCSSSSSSQLALFLPKVFPALMTTQLCICLSLALPLCPPAIKRSLQGEDGGRLSTS